MSYHTINFDFLWWVRHKRKNNIGLNYAGPRRFTSPERRLQIPCRMNMHTYLNQRTPNHVEVLLYRPKASIAQPLFDIPLPPGGGTEIVRTPSGSNAIPDRDDTDLYKNWVMEYWEPVPGQWLEFTLGQTQAETAAANWPGNRMGHRIQPTNLYGMLVPVLFPLRVATTLEAPSSRLMLFAEIRRKSRRRQTCVDFIVDAQSTNRRDVQLGWVPVGLVYDPPGQDMTNSVVESESHGVRSTFGHEVTIAEEEFSTVTQDAGVQLDFPNVGLKATFTHGEASSQASTDASRVTMEITGTQETMVTANNHRTIGRAYWGPLSDIFVILGHPWLGVTQHFNDRSDIGLPPILAMGPSLLSEGTEKILVPTHLLLRPDNDPIASSIPWEERKRILLLNPFVVRDEAILDDINAGVRPVTEGVDRFADPNANNPSRAARVSTYRLSRGTEVNYYESQGFTVQTATTEQEAYSTTITQTQGGQGNWVTGGFGIDTGDRFTINYQATSELSESDSYIQTAKCYLVRNQNDQGSSTLDLYYDTIFGSFMFVVHPEPEADCFEIAGLVTDVGGRPIANQPVSIRAEAADEIRSSTDISGWFRFFVCLGWLELLGTARLFTGGREIVIRDFLEDEHREARRLDLQLPDTRRTLDVARLRIRDIVELFGAPTAERARILGRGLAESRSLEEVADCLGLDGDAFARIEEAYHFVRDGVDLPARERDQELAKEVEQRKADSEG